MKTFRFIGMALFAVLMCVNFASCSSSDDDPTKEKEEEVIVKEKKLTELTEKSSFSSQPIVYKFSYDSKGCLSEIQFQEYEKDGSYSVIEYFYYVWDGNKISVSGTRGTNSTYYLKNSKIESIENHWGDCCYFNFNSNNQLISIIDEDTYSVPCNLTFNWSNDKIESHKLDFIDTKIWDYTYGEEIAKKWYFPNFDWCLGWTHYWNEECHIFLAHPELLGMGGKVHLPKKNNSENYSLNEFSYDIDKDGYVTEFKRKNKAGNIQSYKYKWE